MSSNNKYLFFIVVAVCFVLFVVGFFYPEESRYEYADALFSGLAFVFLVVSVFMQNEDLGLTREELKAARQEMTDQTTAYKESNRLMNRQANETTFFNMLNNSYEKKKGIYFEDSTGERAIGSIYDNLIRGFRQGEERWNPDMPARDFLIHVKEKYKFSGDTGLEMILCGYFESILRVVEYAKEKFNQDDRLNLFFYPVSTMPVQELGLFQIHIMLYHYEEAGLYFKLIRKLDVYDSSVLGSIYDAFLSLIEEQDVTNPSQS